MRDLNVQTVIQLFQFTRLMYYQKEKEYIYIYFECEDLDDYVEMLKERGIHFDQEPTDQRWLWREARLKDPDGNQLILFYGGENRLNPPWRIKSEKL